MKIAVIADIHAHWVGYQAVVEHIQAWQPDRVVVAGDIVNRGPRPADCLRFTQQMENEQGWIVIRGNHEDYVIDQAKGETPHHGPFHQVHKASYWTYEQLGCDVSDLKKLPEQVRFAGPDGREVRVLHASLLGNREGIYPQMDAAELALRSGAEEDNPPGLVIVGHTHVPVIRPVKSTLIVNAGSAGLPFDFDTRPSYAQVTWTKAGWQAEILRVDYNIDQAEREFYEYGYVEGAGPLVQLVLRELREARPYLYSWAVRYQQAALMGEITMEEAVERFLSNL